MSRAERRERKSRAARRAKVDMQIRVRVSEGTKKGIERLADKQNISPSDLIREAFDALLAKHA